MENKKQETRYQPLRKLHYTIKDLTYVWGIGKTKVTEWLNEDRCPNYYIDGTRFVHHEDAEAFVQQFRSITDLEV